MNYHFVSRSCVAAFVSQRRAAPWVCHLLSSSRTAPFFSLAYHRTSASLSFQLAEVRRHVPRATLGRATPFVSPLPTASLWYVSNVIAVTRAMANEMSESSGLLCLPLSGRTTQACVQHWHFDAYAVTRVSGSSCGHSPNVSSRVTLVYDIIHLFYLTHTTSMFRVAQLGHATSFFCRLQCRARDVGLGGRPVASNIPCRVTLLACRILSLTDAVVLRRRTRRRACGIFFSTRAVVVRHRTRGTTALPPQLESRNFVSTQHFLLASRKSRNFGAHATFSFQHVQWR